MQVLHQMMQSDCQACPWECHSHGNPVGNIPWAGTGINCSGMGMGHINMTDKYTGQPSPSTSGVTRSLSRGRKAELNVAHWSP